MIDNNNLILEKYLAFYSSYSFFNDLEYTIRNILPLTRLDLCSCNSYLSEPLKKGILSFLDLHKNDISKYNLDFSKCGGDMSLFENNNNKFLIKVVLNKSGYKINLNEIYKLKSDIGYFFRSTKGKNSIDISLEDISLEDINNNNNNVLLLEKKFIEILGNELINPSNYSFSISKCDECNFFKKFNSLDALMNEI